MITQLIASINNEVTTFVQTALGNGFFTFTLDYPGRTSAGVYNKKQQLIKTLWNNVYLNAGDHTKQWDQTLDNLGVAPLNNYYIKVQSNSVEYAWEGGIGNTSKYNLGGHTIYGGLLTLGMSLTEDKAFYTWGTHEGGDSKQRFLLNDIQVPFTTDTSLYPNNGGGNGTFAVYTCTDGDIVYWAGWGNYPGKFGTYIHAENPSDYTPHIFPDGVASGDATGLNYQSVLGLDIRDISYDTNGQELPGARVSAPTGLAVQYRNKGNLLFQSVQYLNKIQVFHKTLGTLLKEIPLTSPGASACTNNNKLWVVDNQVGSSTTPLYVRQYQIGTTSTQRNIIIKISDQSAIWSSDPYNPDYAASHVFDGTGTFVSYVNPAFIGIQLPDNSETVTSFSVTPPNNAQQAGSFQNVKFQGSNTSQTDGFVDLFTTFGSNLVIGENKFILANPANYKYYRLISSPNTGDPYGAFEILSFNLYKTVSIETYSDVTLTPTGVNILTNTNTAIACSQTNELAVIDDVTSQIYFYDADTGVLTYTLGEAYGYRDNVNVSYNRFMFVFALYMNHPWISYQPDGSFWFGDGGNYRNLHFNANKTYKEQIAWVPQSRMSEADKTDPTRLFSNYLEYSRDYSKTLSNIPDYSWSVKRNWGYKVRYNGGLDFNGVADVITYPNGKTFDVRGRNEMAESGLIPTDCFDNLYLSEGYSIRSDGSFLIRRTQFLDHPIKVYEVPFTGYDSNGYPQFGSETLFVTTSNTSYGVPTSVIGFGSVISEVDETRFIGWRNGGFGYHLGSTRKDTPGEWEWQAVFATPGGNNRTTAFLGEATDLNGDMDCEAYFQHDSSTSALVNHNDIIWVHSVDFYKSQSYLNVISHFNAETGLLIGTCGATWLDTSGKGHIAFYAGNSFANSLVRVNNKLYLYQCDESTSGKKQSIRIGNLESVKVQTIPIFITSNVTKAYDDTDLMSDVSYRNTAFYNQFGWSMTPSSAVGDIMTYPDWTVQTSLFSNANYDIDVDWYCDNHHNTSPDKYVARSLTAIKSNGYVHDPNFTSNNWIVTGQCVQSSAYDNNRWEIVDTYGKVLIHVTALNTKMTVNGIEVLSTDIEDESYGMFLNQAAMAKDSIFGKFNDHIYRNNNGIVTFKYGTYPAVTIITPFEAGGDFTKPAYWRANINSSDSGNGNGAVKQLKCGRNATQIQHVLDNKVQPQPTNPVLPLM